MAVITACLAMRPRIDAEEAIGAYTRVAVGTGSFPQDTAKSIRDGWSELALGPRPRLIVKPTDREMRAIGIKVTRVPRKAPAHG